MNLAIAYQNFGEIRIKGTQLEPLFCLNDVCKVLELTSPHKVKDTIIAEFQGAELNSYPLKTTGGRQNFTFINESQLYFVLMRSDKPNAKIFRQWIVNEVIPSIRKTGGYQMKIMDAVSSTSAVIKAIDSIKKGYQRIAKLEKQLEREKQSVALKLEQFKLLNSAMNEVIHKEILTDENKNADIDANIQNENSESNNGFASKILNTFGGGK